MIRILTLIGARPQIIKAAAISRAISTHFSGELREILVHTGQHYDERMSDIFFGELGIPHPDANLHIGSGGHGAQTGAMMAKIEEQIHLHKPDAVLVYGDTNSTLAGALAASKLHVPVIHIEAGLRSFNKRMPEEINRICCDHVSTLLFCPTQTAVRNLQHEGFATEHTPGRKATLDAPEVIHCGDVMFDNSLYFAQRHSGDAYLEKLDLKGRPFYLATVHRNNNTDDPKRLNALFRAFFTIFDACGIPFVLPIHPRTEKVLQHNLLPEFMQRLERNEAVRIVDPASFLEMIALEKAAEMIFTDSGGVQKEAYFFEKPCIILRSETEWVEVVEQGCARVCDADEQAIERAWMHFTENKSHLSFPPLFGDGHAAEAICAVLLRTFRP